MAESNSTVQQRGGFGKEECFRGVKAEQKCVLANKKNSSVYNSSILSDDFSSPLLFTILDAVFAFLIRLLHFVG